MGLIEKLGNGVISRDIKTDALTVLTLKNMKQ